MSDEKNSDTALSFNAKGYLVPDRPIPSTLAQLKLEFVDRIGSAKRVALYENYLKYSFELKNDLKIATLTQWLDGSFISKKLEPGDIDLVTFLNYQDTSGINIDDYKYPMSVQKYGVDAYIVLIYSVEDSRYPLYIGDRMYWLDKFHKTNRTRTGQKLPKGFLEIIF